MTHLVVSEGTLWVIKCGHKFTQNANRTFFFSISIIINGTCLSPWLVTHFKPRAQFSLLGSGWSFRRVLCYFGFSEREADPKAGLNMQEICRGWGETPVSKRAEVQEKGRERLEMAMWARHPLTGEWGGRRDGVKESRTAAHSKKVSASTMERLGARVAHESFPASCRNGMNRLSAVLSHWQGAAQGKVQCWRQRKQLTVALPDLCSWWRVFTVTANMSAGNDKERD